MTFAFIGASIGACAGIKGCEDAPLLLQSKHLIPFEAILPYDGDGHDYTALEAYLTSLGEAVFHQVHTHKPFIVGGDHSCAIGTWSGLHKYYATKHQEIGLIWVDAHMDSHTPETSPSGNIHGMPLAALMGFGAPHLCNILGDAPKLKSENVILIGIRSYEEGEEARLKRLGIRIYFMEEVEERGLDVVFAEAYNSLAERVPVGLSIDMDGFDPRFAPGVGTPVEKGLDLNVFIQTISKLDLSHCCGLEIAEYNPSLDHNDLTLKNVMRLIEAFSSTPTTSPQSSARPHSDR